MKKSASPTTFGNLCRICSCQDEKLSYIFENDDLLDKITSCLPITIHQGDELPHYVCGKCLQAIDSSYDLIQKAQSSEKFFFDCIKSSEDVKIKVEEGVEDTWTNHFESMSLELDGTFSCDLCDARLPDAKELDAHIQEKHFNQKAPPNTQFTVHKICSLCGQLFDSEESYILHKCENHPHCPHCSKTMPTRCLLNRHITHNCKQLYFCPHCHHAFSTKVSFLKHVQAYTVMMSQSKCEACDRKAHGNGEVTKHTCERGYDENSLTGKKFKCYVCGQSYKRQMNLAKHCLQHQSRNGDFKCTKCNDVFEKESRLHTHLEKVHKMNKSWICRYCGKSMSTKLSVQIHERIHTNVKPYVCEWCGNAFRSKANLIQHHAKHTGIRRHKCPVCGKMFSRTFFLKTHLRVHTGERPFQCDICEQRFTQVGDMRRHRRRHDLANSSTSVATVETQPQQQQQPKQQQKQPQQQQPTVIIVRRGTGQTRTVPIVGINSMPVETYETVQLQVDEQQE